MARPMSRALQERLKRMGRVYSSPVIVKRQCHGEEEKNDAHSSENSQQIGDHQLPEQLGCTSLQTRGQFESGVDVAETLDLGCGDSQADSYCEEADSYCEEQLDSQLEPHSQATSEVELGNWSEQEETMAPIVRTKDKVEKDGAKGVIDFVPAVEKLNEGLKVIRALPTERTVSPQSPEIKVDRSPSCSTNTFRKEVHSVQSLSSSNETKSCTETTVSNESSTLSDPYPVLKTCSVSHYPNVSRLEGPSSSKNVSRTKRPKSPIVSNSKRPASPDVSSVKRPRGSPDNLFDEGQESLQVSGTKRPVVSPNNCSAKRQLSPNDCSAKRLVSPNNSAAKRPVSPSNSSAKRPMSPNNSTVKRPVFPSTSTAERLVSPNSASLKRPVSPNNCSAKRPCVSPNVSSVERQGSPNIGKPVPSPTDVMDSNKASQVASPVGLPGPADDGQASRPGPVDDVDQLKKQRAELLTRLNQKEELLRKLNMVKMYRAKNNLADLQVLIDKWRTVSQDALQELVDITNDPKPSLKELIDHLHLDYKFIGFDPEEEMFLPS